jgi:hypothetical protein
MGDIYGARLVHNTKRAPFCTRKAKVMQYAVIRRADGRYVITNGATQEVLDTANGYGYKTRQSAEKAAWYKFKGGKAKKDTEQRAATAFWRQHADFGKAVQEYYETCFKEIARGETDPDADLVQLAQEMGVEDFRKPYLEYLP